VTESPTPFEISSEPVNGARVVKVAGELDIETHEKLADQLTGEAQHGAIVVDLSACEFIDSSGIRALLLGRRAAGAEEDSSRFAIAAPSQQVLRILEMTGLDTTVPVHASLDEALAAIGSA
jgi:anti-sigma B factor antagonist